MQETRWEFRSPAHQKKVSELLLWACKETEENNQLLNKQNIMNTMRQHHEYDDVFKGLVLTPTEDGFTMFKEEDVLEGIKLN